MAVYARDIGGPVFLGCLWWWCPSPPRPSLPRAFTVAAANSPKDARLIVNGGSGGSGGDLLSQDNNIVASKPGINE